MNEFLKILLSLSISGTLLFLVLALSKRLFKNKISKIWQYYIWLIVVARFLLPFTTEINLVGNIFQQIEHGIPQSKMIVNTENDVLDLTTYSDGDNPAVNQGKNQNSPKQTMVMPVMQNALDKVIQNIWLIWLFIAAMLFIRKVTVYQSFVKYIKAGQVEISDMEHWELLGQLVEQARIKRAVSLYVNPLISSPMLIGFFRPCIMLPTINISKADFEYTLLHELIHYKRRDIFYKWFVQITICIHWFNPAVHFMGREISKACELACDESIIREMTEKEKHAYGNTLIEALNTGGHYEDSLASVTLTESVELLKERLDAIMSFKKRTKWSICFSLLLTVVLICGFSFSGAYAANINQPVNPNPDIAAGGAYDGKSLYFVYTEKGLRSIGTGIYDYDNIYMLANDIDLSSEEWIPIGIADKPFTGTFNGNGFYIKGLTMTNPNAQIVGLFGYAKDAKLHNIELRDTDISTAGAKITEKKIDSICAVPTDTKLTDNRVYEKVKANPNEATVMDTLDFRGKTYYLVFNETQLRAIGTGDYGMDKNYMQQANIQMSGNEWVPIGTADTPFTGSYQGNGYEIIGLTMADPNAKIIGLFGVAENAHIYNITMRDYDIMSAGKNVSTKSIAPILVNGLGETRCYDNFVYPKE